MKLLNIDQLAEKTSKVVVIGGVQYGIVPISVGSFVKKTKEAEEYVKSGVSDPMREVSLILDLISECIPSAPRYAIEALTLPQLQQIAEYIQSDDVDGAEDVEGNV